MQTAAKIAGKLLNGKAVGIGRDLNSPDIVFHIAGQAAGHAGEDEAHPLGAPGVGDGGEAAHHDDVGVAEFLGDALGHAQAVAGAGITVDDVFCHV